MTLSLSYWEIGFIFFLYVALIAVFPMEPLDDLKRDLIAYQYGFDYQNLYIYAHFPRYHNLYPVFDRLVGFLHQHIGFYSFVVVQVCLLVLTIVALFILVKDANYNLQMLIVSICLYFLYHRLMLGRPASFATALFVMGVGLEKQGKAWAHVVIGLGIATLYHLFWVYLLPLLLLRRIYVVPLLLGMMGWIAYAGTDYFVTVFQLATASKDQLIQIAERGSVFRMITFGAIFIPVLYFYRKNLRGLLIMAYFAVANQIRYFENILPIAMSYARYARFRPGWKILLPVVLMLFTGIDASGKNFHVLKKDYFTGHRILTTDISEMYPVVYENTNIKIAPTFHLGWVDRDLQQLLKEIIDTGRLDCQKLARFNFDYIVENNLKQRPECLTFVEPAGEYRIWSTKPPKTPVVAR